MMRKPLLSPCLYFQNAGMVLYPPMTTACCAVAGAAMQLSWSAGTPDQRRLATSLFHVTLYYVRSGG